jgi:hypothetical protein
MAEPVRVALVVFAEVDAVDSRDGASVVAQLIRKQLPFDKVHYPSLCSGQWPVVLRGAMEAGMALGNGYLWAAPTSKLFRESDAPSWAELVRADASSEPTELGGES